MLWRLYLLHLQHIEAFLHDVTHLIALTFIHNIALLVGFIYVVWFGSYIKQIKRN